MVISDKSYYGKGFEAGLDTAGMELVGSTHATDPILRKVVQRAALIKRAKVA